MRPDAADWLRICLVPGIPGTAHRNLLRAFGCPTTVCSAERRSVAAIAGETIADLLATGPDSEAMSTTLSWLDRPGHGFVALGDDDYPRALLEIPDPPTLLYAIGDLSLLNQPAIAVVGSRNATQQGLLDAHEFGRALSEMGFGITSGLALGIDAAAHRGGLAGRSSSIAVVGTGLDRVYPAANRDLAHALADRGVLVSEFPLATPPAAGNFPRRNRIISGLSVGVLVVEAAIKSGSLSTARLALDQGREVFAIPGSIHSPLSKGCHWLIKQGAKLVESADDVLAELGGRQSPLRTTSGQSSGASVEWNAVLEAMGHAPTSIDSLAARTGTSASSLSADLTRLELEGRVERLPGGLYRQLAVP